MNTPNGPEEERPGDLESRWEVVLHGRAPDEETAAVQREIAGSGRRAEFEAQAEVVAAVRGHAARRGRPPGCAPASTISRRRRAGVLSGARCGGPPRGPWPLLS